MKLEISGKFLKQHNLKLNAQKTNCVRFKLHKNNQFNEPYISYKSQVIES